MSTGFGKRDSAPAQAGTEGKGAANAQHHCIELGAGEGARPPHYIQTKCAGAGSFGDGTAFFVGRFHMFFSPLL